MNVPNLTHSAPLFKECHVMPIQDWVKFRTVTMVYKTLHSLTPTYMKEFFTDQSDMSTRNTRYSKVNKLYVPKQNVCVRAEELLDIMDVLNLTNCLQTYKTVKPWHFSNATHLNILCRVYNHLEIF